MELKEFFLLDVCCEVWMPSYHGNPLQLRLRCVGFLVGFHHVSGLLELVIPAPPEAFLVAGCGAGSPSSPEDIETQIG